MSDTPFDQRYTDVCPTCGRAAPVSGDALTALVTLWRNNAEQQKTEHGDAAWTAGYTFKRCADELEVLITGSAERASIELKFQEFIYAVGNQHRGESRHETALRYSSISEQTVREFIGWLSADIPALHNVLIPDLADSWDRFKLRMSAPAPLPAPTTVGPHPPDSDEFHTTSGVDTYRPSWFPRED